MLKNTLMQLLVTLSALVCFSVGADAAVDIAGTLDGSYPTWNRISDRSDVGGYVDSANDALPYEVLEIKTTVAGDMLTATMQGSTQFDSFLALYSAFNPANPQANVLAADDDSGSYPHAQLTKSGLAANSSYYLVISSYSQGADPVYPLLGSYGLSLGGSFFVVPKATTTALGASSITAAPGQEIILTATVAKASGFAVPTGTVTFMEVNTVLGTGTLNGVSQASLTLSSLSAGTHSITASYAGETKYAASVSELLTVTVIPPPAITGISPASGPTTGGTTVTITGTDFTGATVVKFGSSDASSFTVNSDTQITAISPVVSTTSTVDISVTTPGGSSAISDADLFTFHNAFGTADGTYDFGGLGVDDSMGTGSGYARLGDKFMVGNGMFDQWASYNSGPLTAIYPMSSATSAYTAVIKTEGGLTCKSFTFKDLGISAFSESGAEVTFNSFDIVLKDVTGAQIGSTISLGSSGTVSTTSVTNISTLYGQGPWSVDGVASLEITYVVLEGGSAAAAWDLNLENITIANVGTAWFPIVTGISPASGSTNGGTSVTITGTDLLGTSSVKFGIAGSIGYTVDSATQITAISPAGVAGLVADVIVSTLVGTSATSSADQFTYIQEQAKNHTTGTVYASLATALSVALSGAEIRAFDSQFDGAFTLDNGITLKGGYDATFLAAGSNPTTLNGSLAVTNGASTVETLIVKGKLSVVGGSLRVKDVMVRP